MTLVRIASPPASEQALFAPVIWCLNTAPTADRQTPLQTIVSKAMCCFCEVQQGACCDSVAIPVFLEEPNR